MKGTTYKNQPFKENMLPSMTPVPKSRPPLPAFKIFTPAPVSSTFFKYQHSTAEAAVQDADICAVLCSPVDERDPDDMPSDCPDLVSDRSDLMTAFVSDSPYSFGNPVFYGTPNSGTGAGSRPAPGLSVPADFVPVKSKRLLFGKEEPKVANTIVRPVRAIEAGKKPESADEKIKRLGSELYADSPRTKDKLKEWALLVKLKEKNGWDEVVKQSLRTILEMRPKSQWRVVAELADMARKANRLKEARAWYTLLRHMQPLYTQQWLDAAKMADDCGRFEEAISLLRLGLRFCPVNEVLFVKLLRIYEKLAMKDKARSLLSGLAQSHTKPEQRMNAVKLMVEGGLFEQRDGNFEASKKLLVYIEGTKENDAIFYAEYAKQEERLGNLESAKALCDKCIERQPNFPMGWFMGLRLAEKLDNVSYKPAVRQQVVARIWRHVPRELQWKLYVEQGLFSERCGKVEECRTQLSQALLYSPENLRWKLCVLGARIESKAGNLETAMQLLGRSSLGVPTKQQSFLLVEFARAFEFNSRAIGKASMENARKLYQTVQKSHRNDWKVHFESVMFEARCGRFTSAEETAVTSLEVHPTTGRLWAALIQLHHIKDRSGKTAYATLLRALGQTPKSGEVWCEAAKLYMSPYAFCFDLGKARKCLKFALHFTPQYGDSFIEMLRLCLIEECIGTAEDPKAIDYVLRSCRTSDPNYGQLWSFCKKSVLDSANDVITAAKTMLEKEVAGYARIIEGRVNGKGVPEGTATFVWAGIERVGEVIVKPERASREECYRMIYGYEQIIM